VSTCLQWTLEIKKKIVNFDLANINQSIMKLSQIRRRIELYMREIILRFKIKFYRLIICLISYVMTTSKSMLGTSEYYWPMADRGCTVPNYDRPWRSNDERGLGHSEIVKLILLLAVSYLETLQLDIFGWVNIYKIATMDLKYGAHYPLKLCLV
jgi:hypothetical protein